MLHIFKKSILLSILTLLFSSCASKVKGKYHTKYSYHPYYNLYAKKMSNQPLPQIRKVNAKSRKSKLSLSFKGRFPDNSVSK